jgi:hypothetical protein
VPHTLRDSVAACKSVGARGQPTSRPSCRAGRLSHSEALREDGRDGRRSQHGYDPSAADGVSAPCACLARTNTESARTVITSLAPKHKVANQADEQESDNGRSRLSDLPQ